jgi:hypothetical protein
MSPYTLAAWTFLSIVTFEIVWLLLKKVAWPMLKAYAYPAGIWLLCRVLVLSYSLHCWAAVKLRTSPVEPIPTNHPTSA